MYYDIDRTSNYIPNEERVLLLLHNGTIYAADGALHCGKWLVDMVHNRKLCKVLGLFHAGTEFYILDIKSPLWASLPLSSSLSS
jgi:hypothetical protein